MSGLSARRGLARLIPFRRVRFGALWEASRTFRPALVGQRKTLLASLVLALAATAAELLKPWPIKVLFDEVLIVDEGARLRWNLSLIDSLRGLQHLSQRSHW